VVATGDADRLRQSGRGIGAEALSYEQLLAENESLRRRAERAEAALAALHREGENAPWCPSEEGGADPVAACPYQELIESVNAVVLFLDPEGYVGYANPFAASFMGCPLEEFIGADIRDFIPDTASDGTDQSRIVEMLLSDPECNLSAEYEIQRPDGSRVVVSWSRRPRRDSDGELCGIVSIGTDMTLQKDAERRLVGYQEQLRSLTSELALTEERERKSIATRIHDEISQNLAYTKLRVGSLNGCASGEHCKPAVEEINRLLDAAIAGSRALAFELSPPLLYELGFDAAVEWLVEHLDAKHEEVVLHFSHDGHVKPLSGDVSVTLFRAVVALVRNVIEHSEAKHASVALQAVDGTVSIRVEDDGVGFDPAIAMADAEPKPGLGLLSIRERLRYLGGTMEIDSRPGEGTTVTLRVPLRNGD
jgi:PAS domain S-box-containing protein